MAEALALRLLNAAVLTATSAHFNPITKNFVVYILSLSGFTGTIDLKGSVRGADAAASSVNVMYLRRLSSVAAYDAPSVAQMSFTTTTGIYFAVVAGEIYEEQWIEMTRSVGTITADVMEAGTLPLAMTVSGGGSALLGTVAISQTTPGTTNGVQRLFPAGTATSYRTSVAAADVIASPGTVTCTKQAGGSATAGTYTTFVVAGNTYGRTTATQGNTTITTETTNLTIRAAFAAVTGATFYDIYCSTDGAAAKFVGRITETQRGTGIKITAVNVTGAGGTAGAVDIEVPGTGLAVNGGQLAQNTAYTPESLTPIVSGTVENLDMNVTFSRTGDIVVGSLVLIPFYAGASSRYYAGDPVPVSFGGTVNAYESNRQTLRLPVRGRSCVVVVASIAGTGATVTLEYVSN